MLQKAKLFLYYIFLSIAYDNLHVKYFSSWRNGTPVFARSSAFNRLRRIYSTNLFFPISIHLRWLGTFNTSLIISCPLEPQMSFVRTRSLSALVYHFSVWPMLLKSLIVVNFRPFILLKPTNTWATFTLIYSDVPLLNLYLPSSLIKLLPLCQ